MSNNRKLNQPTKLKLSELEDDELRSRLEMLYEGYRVQRELDVEHQRSASIATLKSQMQKAQAQITLLEFLNKASEGFPEVSQEAFWFVYRKDGEIVLESPFTEKDMRNAVRVQRDQLNQQVDQLSEDNDLYESGESD